MDIKFQAIDGYAYGAIQPSILLRFSASNDVSAQLVANLELFLNYLPAVDKTPPFEGSAVQVDAATAASLTLRLLNGLNSYCGDQRFTPIKVFEEDDQLVYALPTLSPMMSRHNVEAVSQFLKETQNDFSKADVEAFADKLKATCRRFLPSGTNAANFIAVAAERRIPFKIFSSSYLIFGYGSGSTIFKSSLTDRDSVVGVSLAKSKVDTNRLLKMSGLPVADQAQVRSIEEALHYANVFGYPVALKPEAEEQGRGVSPNIMDDLELKSIYKKLGETFNSLILEKHIHGDGYRVYVLDHEVAEVDRLIAAHVIGDGLHSIKELISIENMSPKRNSIFEVRKKIKIDEDVEYILKKQGVRPDHIPQLHQKILLSPTSNTSRGGTSEDFTKKIHMDNVELCISATKILGLHFSGVDLISEDASVSWRSNNTVVCEVNAQPQIGTRAAGQEVDIYAEMVTKAVGEFPKVTISISAEHTDQAEYSNILNKALDNVRVHKSIKAVLRDGAPTQYFHSLEIADDVSAEDRRKVEHMLVSVEPEHVPHKD